MHINVMQNTCPWEREKESGYASWYVMISKGVNQARNIKVLTVKHLEASYSRAFFETDN